jgi:hypothetical protein
MNDPDWIGEGERRRRRRSGRFPARRWAPAAAPWSGHAKTHLRPPNDEGEAPEDRETHGELTPRENETGGRPEGGG